MNIYDIFLDMSSSAIVKLVFVLIATDLIFSILKDIKERTINFKIETDNLIKRFGMILVVIVLYCIDCLVKIDFTAWIPTEISTFLNIKDSGLCELFSIIFILFESMSILNNLNILGIPLPKKMKAHVEKFLKDITEG